MRLGLLGDPKLLSDLEKIHPTISLRLTDLVAVESLRELAVLVCQIDISEIEDYARPLLKLAGLKQRPRIILNLKGSKAEQVLGMQLTGIDQVLINCRKSELLARVRASLRFESVLYKDLVRLGRAQFDHKSGRLRGADKILQLSRKESRILKSFVYQGRYLQTRDEIIKFAWGDEHHFDRSTINVYMHRLRQKFAKVGAEGSLETLPGRGYRLYYLAS